MSEPDSVLVERARGGDRDSLSELLLRHMPDLRTRMASKIGPAWRGVLDADDVVQVTVMEAFLRFAQFAPQGENGFPAWLAQIAENNLRDAIRGLERAKRPNPRRRVRSNAQNSTFALLEQVAQHSSTPSKIMRRQESVSLLDEAIGQLPENYRVVIRAYDLDGRPAGDVAREINKTEGAVYMIRARALERLKELLGTSFLRLG